MFDATSSSNGTKSKPPSRVLACTSCQQRKIKCDRHFPCQHCTKSGLQCIPAALIQKTRRKRFAERELLDRVRHYEDLLRENGIPFDPIHSAQGKSPQDSAADKSDAKAEPLSHGPKYAMTPRIGQHFCCGLMQIQECIPCHEFESM